VRSQGHSALGCEDPLERDSFEAHSFVCESLMAMLVRANMKQTCKLLWPDLTKVHNERVTARQQWRYCLYRTGDQATNQTVIYPRTMEWKDLRTIAREHKAADVPEALKDDPVLFLLFVNIFPFRATFSALKSLHKTFDGTWFL